MSDEPVGLAMGEAFREYVARLRETWPAREQPLATAGGDEPPTDTSHTA